MNEKRTRLLKEHSRKDGPVVYWMSRDQRASDNWALLYAQRLSLTFRQPLAVVFCLVPDFLGATRRQYGFMLRGLEALEGAMRNKDIPFFLLRGYPDVMIPEFIATHNVCHLVTDFDPLRIKRSWLAAVVRKVEANVVEVDAHNIVPCWIASGKQEYGAYTFRPKIKKLLPEFLEQFPSLTKQKTTWPGAVPMIPWPRMLRDLTVDPSVGEVTWLASGERAAEKALQIFVQKRLGDYAHARNDPGLDGQSGLSPYFHFGQLAPQRAALAVFRAKGDSTAKDVFLEELIVRRELSDNFCYYNPHYDQVKGFPSWARQTLALHRRDSREYLYASAQLEHARTHDLLWNAAQMEMVRTGKMHGYMRMYWAKKILEWSPSVQAAMRTAVYLNDKYELDGRDPNGYAGIAWSLGGVHDRAWGERPVFGKIRFMSFNGCKQKFDIKAYVNKAENDLGQDRF